MAQKKTAAYARTSVAVVGIGFKDTYRLMGQLDKPLQRKVKFAIRDEAVQIRKIARDRYDLLSDVSGDSPMPRNVPLMKKKAKYYVGASRSVQRRRTAAAKPIVAYRVQNMSKPGAMFENAQIPHTPQGANMIDALNRHAGSPGRFIVNAYMQRRAPMQRNVEAAVRSAQAEFDKKLLSGYYASLMKAKAKGRG